MKRFCVYARISDSKVSNTIQHVTKMDKGTPAAAKERLKSVYPGKKIIILNVLRGFG